eukprot:GHVN01002282.1.p1 GENE.GHVN01002282.1~~GHVN01002282.1.p1  ORF type:complete len:972 (-),score=89.94 GHVN01002282.1:37-2952(-)
MSNPTRERSANGANRSRGNNRSEKTRNTASRDCSLNSSSVVKYHDSHVVDGPGSRAGPRNRRSDDMEGVAAKAEVSSSPSEATLALPKAQATTPVNPFSLNMNFRAPVVNTTLEPEGIRIVSSDSDDGGVEPEIQSRDRGGSANNSQAASQNTETSSYWDPCSVESSPAAFADDSVSVDNDKAAYAILRDKAQLLSDTALGSDSGPCAEGVTTRSRSRAAAQDGSAASRHTASNELAQKKERYTRSSKSAGHNLPSRQTCSKETSKPHAPITASTETSPRAKNESATTQPIGTVSSSTRDTLTHPQTHFHTGSLHEGSSRLHVANSSDGDISQGEDVLDSGSGGGVEKTTLSTKEKRENEVEESHMRLDSRLQRRHKSDRSKSYGPTGMVRGVTARACLAGGDATSAMSSAPSTPVTWVASTATSSSREEEAKANPDKAQRQSVLPKEQEMNPVRRTVDSGPDGEDTDGCLSSGGLWSPTTHSRMWQYSGPSQYINASPGYTTSSPRRRLRQKESDYDYAPRRSTGRPPARVADCGSLSDSQVIAPSRNVSVARPRGRNSEPVSVVSPIGQRPIFSVHPPFPQRVYCGPVGHNMMTPPFTHRANSVISSSSCGPCLSCMSTIRNPSNSEALKSVLEAGHCHWTRDWTCILMIVNITFWVLGLIYVVHATSQMKLHQAHIDEIKGHLLAIADRSQKFEEAVAPALSMSQDGRQSIDAPHVDEPTRASGSFRLLYLLVKGVFKLIGKLLGLILRAIGPTILWVGHCILTYTLRAIALVVMLGAASYWGYQYLYRRFSTQMDRARQLIYAVAPLLTPARRIEEENEDTSSIQPTTAQIQALTAVGAIVANSPPSSAVSTTIQKSATDLIGRRRDNLAEGESPSEPSKEASAMGSSSGEASRRGSQCKEAPTTGKMVPAVRMVPFPQGGQSMSTKRSSPRSALVQQASVSSGKTTRAPPPPKPPRGVGMTRKVDL